MMKLSKFDAYGLSKFILFYYKYYDTLLITRGFRWIAEQSLIFTIKTFKPIINLNFNECNESPNIHIIIRHLPINENRNRKRHENQRPDWFDYDLCFSSLFNSIKSIDPGKIQVRILYDGSVESFEHDIIQKHIKSANISEVIFINGGSEMASGIILHNYVRSLNLNKEDLIYFIENDYLHNEFWYDEFMEFNKIVKNWGFVSFFNHPNEKANNKIKIGAINWGEIFSTTGTYLVKAEVYYKLNLFYKLLRKDYRFFRFACKGLKIKMYTPLPTLSQHAMKSDIATSFDLNKFISK